MTLYRSAAEKGLWQAQFNLARMYALGIGMQKNEAEAARLYQMAASHDTMISASGWTVLLDEAKRSK